MTSRSRGGSEPTATWTSNASISAMASASGGGPWAGIAGASPIASGSRARAADPARLLLGDGQRLGPRPWVGSLGRLADHERHARPSGVDCGVPSDGEEPGRGRAALAPVAACGTPDRRERLLRDVVGRVVV